MSKVIVFIFYVLKSTVVPCTEPSPNYCIERSVDTISVVIKDMPNERALLEREDCVLDSMTQLYVLKNIERREFYRKNK